MDNFTIRTKITPKEYVKAMYIGMYKRPLIIIITLIGLYNLTTVVLDHLHIIHFYTERPVFEMCAGLFLLAAPSIIVLMAFQHFKSNKNLTDFVTFTFGESGVTVQAITYKAEYSWPHIVKQKEISKFLVLYHSKKAGNFIDKTTLTTEQLNFIKSKVVQTV